MLVGIGVGVVVLGAIGFGAYRALAPSPRPAAPGAPTTTAQPSTTPPAPLPAPATVTPAPASPATYDVSQEFARLMQGRSADFDVRLRTNHMNYRIGKDELSFVVTTEREGYLYVFVYGADQTLTQLYPNDKSGPIKVAKGQVLKLPQGDLYFPATDPPGPQEVVAMISPHERDFSALHSRKDGFYHVFPTGAEAVELASQFRGGPPSLAGRAVCPGAGDCDQSYGAALVKVEIMR